MNNVKNSTWFVLGGFVAFLICAFALPAFSLGGFGSISLWDVGGLFWLGFIPLLLAAIAAAILAFGNSTTMPKIGNLSTEMLITGLSAIGTIFILLRTILKPGGGLGGLSYSFGGFVCTLFAALMTYGGFMMMKEKGESLDRFKNMQFSGQPGAQQGYGAPPPGYGQPPAPGGYAPPPAPGASYAPPPPPPAAPGAYSPPPPPPPGATPPPPPPPR